MRLVYAHEAVLVPDPDADDRAPAGAVTAALGAKEPAHHTAAERRGGELHLRILFATAPHRAGEVRQRIDDALAAGAFTGPDGRTSSWRTVRSGCVAVAAADREPARRLLR